MAVPTSVTGDGIVLSPHEQLVAGGPAEEFERRLQALFHEGYRRIVTDLSGVTRIDSAGIRALVRGLTTAQRLGGSFTLVAPSQDVLTVLQLARLDTVFTIFDRLGPALAKRWPWRTTALCAGGTLLAAALAVGAGWTALPVPDSVRQWLPDADAAPGRSAWWQPFVEFGKLVLSALIGVTVTVVHRHYRDERTQTRTMEQAQVLLCVAGAMMMIVIGNSLARAFGIAGAASVIRFRTPVEDPKDITILFLLMGLGMAAGVGETGVAALGTLFLCLLLVVLDRVGARRPRAMMARVEAEGREFPTAHVQGVFARNQVIFEPREVSQGKDLTVRYHALLNSDQSLEDLSDQLMADGKARVKSVSWELPRKSG